MPKITITFQEEGDQPTTVEIPAEITEKLQSHVAYLQSEGVPVNSKTEMFVWFTWQNWLKPVLEKQGVSVLSLAGPAGQQVQTLETQLAQARQQAEYAAMLSAIQITQV